VRDYLAGKEAALQFLMGQIMRRTQGRATPQLARQEVLQSIEARRSSSETEPA
jgi:aspartyl-tRNA(Asn)/glutamyl-tRNA(Gln) amidotransferase subunit B